MYDMLYMYRYIYVRMQVGFHAKVIHINERGAMNIKMFRCAIFHCHYNLFMYVYDVCKL